MHLNRIVLLSFGGVLVSSPVRGLLCIIWYNSRCRAHTSAAIRPPGITSVLCIPNDKVRYGSSLGGTFGSVAETKFKYFTSWGGV